MKLATKIFKLMVLLQPLLLYAMAFRVTILMQLISDFILVGAFIQIFSVLRMVASNSKHNLILAISIMLIALLSLYLGGFSYDGFIAYLMFVSMLSSWLVFPYINLMEMNSICKYSFLIQALLLLYFSQQTFAYDYIEDEVLNTSDSLSLGFNNPNLAGMIIFYVFVVILLYYNEEKKTITKLLFILLLSSLFYLIYKTDCRTVLFMGLFLVISFLLTSKSRILETILKSKFITIVTLAFPVIFGFLYVYLFQLPELRDIEILGKPLFSGRQTMFVDFYKTLSESPILGLCGKYKFANAHNGILTILLNTGFAGLFLYIVYVYRNIRSVSNSVLKPTDVLSLIAIIAVYVNSSNESAMLVAGNLFYVYFMCLLVFTKRNAFQ